MLHSKIVALWKSGSPESAAYEPSESPEAKFSLVDSVDRLFAAYADILLRATRSR